MEPYIAEHEIQKAVLDMLERNHIYHIRKAQLAGDRKGISDIILCFKGHYIEWEMKDSLGGIVSPQQVINANWVRNSGGLAYVVSSFDQAIDILQELDPTFVDSNKKVYESDALEIKRR